jgi:D-3-phosphoglycerate dehydrogenase
MFLIKKMKLNLLFSAPSYFLPTELKSLYEDNFNVQFIHHQSISEIKELLNDVHIWVTPTCPDSYIDTSILQYAPKLKILATPSTGTTHLDEAGFISSGVKVCSIKHAAFLNEIYASSEHTFGLLLAMMRNTVAASNAVLMNGEWRENEHLWRGEELNGKTIGIIGYGRIGGNLSKYANVFEMKVFAFDPFKKINDNWVIQHSDLNDMLPSCDIVSINYHYTGIGTQIFGKEQFLMLKDMVYFINTARGELIDENALLEGLKEGRIKAAAVDVVQRESYLNDEDNPMIDYARRNNNLLITPHIAGLTIQSESKAAREILNEILNSLDGSRK